MIAKEYNLTDISAVEHATQRERGVRVTAAPIAGLKYIPIENTPSFGPAFECFGS